MAGKLKRQIGGRRGFAPHGAGVMAAMLLFLSACEEQETILPGKREPLREAEELASVDVITQQGENRSEPLSLPGQQDNAGWTQSHASPDVRVNHPAFGGAMQPLWSAKIGAGNSRHGRITADPVVADGKIFTLDSEALVSAVSTSGQVVWTRNLVPARDAGRDATGGGLAYADGKIFISSGFGLLTALDAETGEELWQQKLQAPGSGSPSVSGGLVYLVAGDKTAWAVDADTGRIRWQLAAASDKNNILGGAAPAVNDRLVVFSFGSNEVQAAFKQGGLRLWDSVISGRRSGFARSRISDVTGGPVIVGDTIYAGTHSGRMVALETDSGARKWTVEEGPMSPVWVAGDAVFLVTEGNDLVRLDAATGEYVWVEKLPFFIKDRPRRQRGVFAHYGPVLAGGKLYVASSDGLIRAFDPVDGSQTGQADIRGGASSAPVFAGGVMYVVSGNGELLAFR